MKVVELDSSKNEKKTKQHMLDILEEVRKNIEDGTIKEYLVASMDSDAEITLYGHTNDFVGTIGMLETAKHNMLMEKMLGPD
jgi:hypothetical protein